jgi:hypothetical protein
MLAEGHKPFEVRVNERIAAVQQSRMNVGIPPQTDPTALAMMNQKAVALEKKRDKPVRLINHSRFQRHRIHL